MAIRFLLIIGGLLGVCQRMSAVVYTGDCGYNGNNLTYSLNTSTGVLTISGTGVMKNWSSANNVPWYNYRTSVTSVTIGDNITTIGQFAFYGCTALTSVSISSSVTTIANGAFSYCSSLTSIIIPNSVTGIAPAFTHCPVLTDIYVSWTTTDALPFWYSMTDKTPSTIKLHVPCSTTAQYQAKNGWKDYTIVEDRAFGPCGANGYNLIWSLSCDGTLTISGTGAMVHYWSYPDIPWWNYRGSIQRIVIEEGVTTIGNHAFVQCSNLTSVSLPNTLTAISYLAFGHCIGLPSLTIPSSVTSMADMFIHNT